MTYREIKEIENYIINFFPYTQDESKMKKIIEKMLKEIKRKRNET